MISKINTFKLRFGILTKKAEIEARNRLENEKDTNVSKKIEELIEAQKNIHDIEIDYDNVFFNIYGIGLHSNDVRFLPWNTCDFIEACEISQKYQNIING